MKLHDLVPITVWSLAFCGLIIKGIIVYLKPENKDNKLKAVFANKYVLVFLSIVLTLGITLYKIFTGTDPFK